MANFKNTKYESNGNTIHSIRLSTLTAATTPANPTPEGDINSPIKVKVSKSRRAFGIRPRGVTLAREIAVNVGTDTYYHNLYKFLPILTKAAYDGGSFQEGQDVQYAGNTYLVVGRIAEDY